MSTPTAFTLSRTLFNPDLYHRVQSLWFATQPASNPAPTDASVKKWFFDPDRAAAASFDAQLRAEFLPALQALFPDRITLPPAARSWADEHAQAAHLAAPFLPSLGEGGKGALGLVLLLDQVARNTLRGEQQGIVYGHIDRLSRAVARTVLAEPLKADRQIGSYARRQWFYMPFMHSEWMEDHEVFNRSMEEMRADSQINVNEDVAKALDNQEKFEDMHVKIIRQFGRYPHRNKFLGRQTTAEEKAWLEGGGDTFGA
ncbi:hypothetical protein K461DRAFT_273646 [Myriangium duriaei CBS 260.36]|uniref:DUF924-domain-containing protein n=1 Tax=Myriangium duriaei CBS 260.36 TaxID=1168546 RepID=A0A9P4MLK8_9PEZI|nr:hypothetical protein K461DRAFT_273646 [Myriangium duriaei CBS 260.36]